MRARAIPMGDTRNADSVVQGSNGRTFVRA